MASRKRLRGSNQKQGDITKYFRHCTDHIDNMPPHSADGTESTAADLQTLSHSQSDCMSVCIDVGVTLCALH